MTLVRTLTALRFGQHLFAAGLVVAATTVAAAQQPPKNFILHGAPKPIASIAFEDEQGAEPRRLPGFIERRNRAIIAFTWLTGVRDGALVTLKLRHVDLITGAVNQDAREVATKNSKSQYTTFFEVDGSAREIVNDWIGELGTTHLFGPEEPVFPATLIEQDANLQFCAGGISRSHWRNADAVRKIFRQSFESVGLPAFNPHSVRHTLAMLGERKCRTPEEFKAWSQNLGHEGVLTTLTSYGAVPPHRQVEIIRSLGKPAPKPSEATAFAREVAEALAKMQAGQGPSQ